MDFKDTPEQAKFRKTCREWLENNAALKDASPSESTFALTLHSGSFKTVKSIESPEAILYPPSCSKT